MKPSRIIATVLAAILLLMITADRGDAQTKPKAKEESKNVESKKEIAVVETSLGTFEFELYRNDAPKTVENFVKLAQKSFFDGMRVHRVAKGFVIQSGDEKSKDPKKINEWGTGGKSIYGKDFADELNPATPSYKEGYKKGVVAMANRGPNTNSSQFFVMLSDLDRMPKNYTIFGKVIRGMEVVEKIGNVEIIPGMMGPTDGRPKEDVLLKKVTITKAPAATK
jgi:cyclophilin family peptidyl-prolyl cis-trans isomerase